MSPISSKILLEFLILVRICHVIIKGWKAELTLVTWHNGLQSGIELATSRSPVRRPNHYTPPSHPTFVVLRSSHETSRLVSDFILPRLHHRRGPNLSGCRCSYLERFTPARHQGRSQKFVLGDIKVFGGYKTVE